MSDPTDLSKLSSTEIIAKIGNLYQTSQDGPMPGLHALVVVLKQAVIREASVGRISIKHVVAVGNFVDDEHVTFTRRPQDRHWLDYDLIPQETP